MAWDFETDPEYQARLDWADAFVPEHAQPLEEPLDMMCERTLSRKTQGGRLADGWSPINTGGWPAPFDTDLAARRAPASVRPGS